MLLKLKVCLAKYEDISDQDFEAGIHRSISQITLRVPENGGVEWKTKIKVCQWKSRFK